MTTGAIYNVSTGMIQQTITPPLSNGTQLAGLESTGLKQIIIPDGKNGSTGMIDLTSGQYVDYAPPGAAVPSVFSQLMAALVNSQVIPASSIHPQTVAEINSQLAPANMNTIATTAAASPDPATKP